MKYKILEAFTTDQLEALVNRLMAVGFVPTGGILYKEGAGCGFYQAVVDFTPNPPPAPLSGEGDKP